ncbi:hypothetical protein F4780DRAFT_778039 [Xylariomycetidae sp. FL0641]|nr:hypothetical protein F4780DRAFT_778039 [Xylariomycetidae sp. FL0641]
MEATTGNSGVTFQVCPAVDSDVDDLPQESPNEFSASALDIPRRPPFKSAKSVEDVNAIGTFPLGSLRVNEPDLDDSPLTPLTIPDMDRSDPKFACLKTGDVFLLDDLPAGFTIGCDTISFNASQPFPGFRHIPSGAHLIWVAPSESTSSRSAYWIFTPERDADAPGEAYVKQWDKFNEILSDPASLAEERIQKENLEKTFESLAPYQLEAAPPKKPKGDTEDNDTEAVAPSLDTDTVWYQLTFAIYPALLNRITGQAQKTWPVTTTDRVVGEPTLAEEARLYAKGASQLHFTFPMDAHLVNPAAEGAERTRQALDPTSWILDKLEGSMDDEVRSADDLIGELQFAFLTGAHLGNFSCLEQWWFLATRVVFRAYDLVTARPALARHLILTVHAQLLYNDRYLQGDSILDAMPVHAKDLQKALITYKARLDERLDDVIVTEDVQAVGAAFGSLEAYLTNLGWDLGNDYVRSGTVMLEDGEVVQAELSDFEDEDERGEFAPVVVNMADGKEEGLVSFDK